MKLFGQVVQGGLIGLANCRRKTVSHLRGLFVGLSEHHWSANRVFDFVKRLGVSGFFVEDLDDVEAVLSFDQIGDAAFWLAKGYLFKLRNGLALGDPT